MDTLLNLVSNAGKDGFQRCYVSLKRWDISRVAVFPVVVVLA